MLSLFIGTLLSLSAWGGDKISLQERTAKIQKTEEIRELYKSSAELGADPGKAFQGLFKSNKASWDVLKKDFLTSGSFVRGEIEDEKTLNQLMAYLQLSMVKVRSSSFQGQWSDVREEFSAWLLFAADFPYEESSLVGLRTSGVIRSLILDEIERIQKKFAAEIAKDSQFRKWFLGVRAPWPVDRILVSEARRLLKPPMVAVANSAALAYQKNPYQSVEKSLARVKGGQSEESKLLKQIWRDEDIQLMKTEINRIGKLKVRLALAEYEVRHQKPAQSIQVLVQEQLLDQVPVDYFSGKPMDLTSL